MITRILLILNLFVTISLLAALMEKRPLITPVLADSDVIRAKRIEIVDSSGRVAASLGYDDGTAAPFLVFHDENGREAMSMRMSHDGEPAMYFVSKKGRPSVAVGYLVGSDVRSPHQEEDPLSSWGIRIRVADKVRSFDSFDLDPETRKRINKAIAPVSAPAR